MVVRYEDLNTEDRYRHMQAHYDGRCTECHAVIYEGDQMVWDTKEFKAYCEDCGRELV